MQGDAYANTKHANKTWIAVYQQERNARMKREQGNKDVEYTEETITLLSFNLTS